MTTNPKPQPGNHETGSGRTRFVVLALGIVVAAALVWMFVGSLNNNKGPVANASDASPMQTTAPGTTPGSPGASAKPAPANTSAKPAPANTSVKPAPASTTAKAPAPGNTDSGKETKTPAAPASPTAPGNEVSTPPSAAPVTDFEASKPSNWPEGKTTGCTYVLSRLDGIQAEVKASGVEAMRNSLDAIDDLQGDPSMSEHSPGFDAVKRTWSTALAAAEESSNADGGQALTDGTTALQELVDGIQCK